MTKLRRPETQRVAEFLYDLLVANSPSRDYAKRVAERMDVPYPSMARYWQGRAAFPAGLVRSLFRATDYNLRVAEFFLLEESGFCLDRRDSTPRRADIQRDLMLLNQMEGEITGLYLAATDEQSDDGEQISYTEARELAEALRKLARIAENLRGVIKSMHDLQ